MRTITSLFLVLSLACAADVNDEDTTADDEEMPDMAAEAEPYCCDCDAPTGADCWPSSEAECALTWCEDLDDCIAQCNADDEYFDACCMCHPTDGLVCSDWPTDSCHEIGLEVFPDCTFDEALNIVCPGACEEAGDGDGDG